MRTVQDNSRGRFRSIDGLRGIAALSVVFYHLSLNLQPELQLALPGLVNTLLSYGYLGVPVFFVISGLVVPLSLSRARVDRRYAGKYVLRRAVRLDITYWASIFVVLLLLMAEKIVLGIDHTMPSTTSILLHMVYLQDLLVLDPVISAVYWTLCLEIQFYLFYLLTLWLSQRAGPISEQALHLSIIVAVGFYSLLIDQGLVAEPWPGLFIGNWHYFLLGALVSNVVRNAPNSIHCLFAWVAVEVGFLLSGELKPYAVAGNLTALGLLWLWLSNRQDSVLRGPVWQYFGAMSYSLYLLHASIGWKSISLGKYLYGAPLPPAMAVVLLFMGFAASVVAAHFSYQLLERPSLRLNQKLRNHSLGELLGLSRPKPATKVHPVLTQATVMELLASAAKERTDGQTRPHLSQAALMELINPNRLHRHGIPS